MSAIKYVYNLPYCIRAEICEQIDQTNIWPDLAQLMKFNASVINEIKDVKSPADELLTKWEQYNHEVWELYYLLNRLNQERLVELLKPYVDKRYHYLSKPKNRVEDQIVKELTTVRCIPYKELIEATDDWNNANKLGEGGFGVVYKGTWKLMSIAIKKLKIKSTPNHDETLNINQTIKELKFLSSKKHDNILNLYGYSIDDSEYPCLIYQYMPGGSLDQRLRPKSSSQILNWIQRIKIVLGVARGLHFLHTADETPLIHLDIKPGNILLDQSNEPKIGDFGLSRELSKTNNEYCLVSRLFGTAFYLPDEYLRSRVISTKLDVYSFGVVLFEIATGLYCYNKRTETNLTDFILNYEGDITDLKDKRCPSVDHGLFELLIEVGKECVQRLAKNRPEIIEVYKKLYEFVNKININV